MTTTTKTNRITITLVHEFNGEVAGWGMTTHDVRSPRGLLLIARGRARRDGWTLRLALDGEAPSGSATIAEVRAWLRSAGIINTADWLDAAGIQF